MKKTQVVFMVSGSGTNMENLIRHMQEGKLDASAAAVICDRPGVGAIERAHRLGVPVHVIDRKEYSDKSAFEAAMIKVIDSMAADYVVLAGFMRILSDEFVLKYWGKIINIHPSFLPEFPGAHGIRDAFQAKVKETGVTVHFVDTGVDTGKVILQKRVPVMADDTLETLEARIHSLEYQIYPEALKKLFSGEVSGPGPAS